MPFSSVSRMFCLISSGIISFWNKFKHTTSGFRIAVTTACLKEPTPCQNRFQLWDSTFLPIKLELRQVMLQWLCSCSVWCHNLLKLFRKSCQFRSREAKFQKRRWRWCKSRYAPLAFGYFIQVFHCLINPNLCEWMQFFVFTTNPPSLKLCQSVGCWVRCYYVMHTCNKLGDILRIIQPGVGKEILAQMLKWSEYNSSHLLVLLVGIAAVSLLVSCTSQPMYALGLTENGHQSLIAAFQDSWTLFWLWKTGALQQYPFYSYMLLTMTSHLQPTHHVHWNNLQGISRTTDQTVLEELFGELQLLFCSDCHLSFV